MTTRATCWSITINNPTEKDEEEIELARQKGWRVEGQKEKGENGTPHYQLMVSTPQVRFSAVKKMFSRAHIEVAKNRAALAAYVTKEATREGELASPSDKYPSLNKLWDMIYLKYNTKDKDGWYDAEHYGLDPEPLVRFYYEHVQRKVERDPLKFLGETCAQFITEGYFVEHHIANPAVRWQWSNFWQEILTRSKGRQTDRQTNSVQIQQVNIPVMSIPNADDNQGEENGLSRSRWDASSEDDEDYSSGTCQEIGASDGSGSEVGSEESYCEEQ